MLFLVLAPIHSVAVAIIALVLMDLVTGLWAAFKRKEQITSVKLSKSFSKVVLYLIGIAFCFVMETLLVDGVPLVKALAGVIALREGKSFFENLHVVSGIDFWSEAIKKIQAATAKTIPEEVTEVVHEIPEEKPKKRKSKKKKSKK
jgi:phage-related holin